MSASLGSTVESRIASGAIGIAVEEYGNRTDPAMLLIQGLGMSLAAWPPAYIKALLAAGFRVVVFDNRDVGKSDYLDDLGVPNLFGQAIKRQLGFTVEAPYQLGDMAQDAVAVLDALQIDAAHFVGVSMGGMLAQLVAIHNPDRVASLTSIMSSTANRDMPGPTAPVRMLLLRGPAGPTIEDRYDYHRRLWGLLGSPEYPLSDGELDAFLKRIFERGMRRDATARQSLAILAAEDRRSLLQKVRAATLVIHGDADPLVNVKGGYDTAAAVPNARCEIITGMGHDLPLQLAPMLTDLIASHAMRAKA